MCVCVCLMGWIHTKELSTKLNLTTRRHFIRDAAMRVKGYKMCPVYIKVLINGEIGFEKII